MKKTFLIGALLLMINLVSCVYTDIYTDHEYVPLVIQTEPLEGSWTAGDSVNVVTKDFNRISTRTTVTPVWEMGNQILVYSLDEDGTVLCKCICDVYNIDPFTNNYANITATVAEECMGYFAVCPISAANYDVGDVIDVSITSDFDYLIPDIQLTDDNYTGLFGDAAIMTSWCRWTPASGRFDFVARTSILHLKNINNNMCPMHIELYEDGNTTPLYTSQTWSSTIPYSDTYFPIATHDIQVSIKVYYKNNSKNKLFPSSGYKLLQIGQILTLTGDDVK